MTNKTFILDYEIHFKDGHRDVGKKMRIKNCMGELHAKIRLEGFMKLLHQRTFDKIVVFSCMEDKPMGGLFDLFGGKNPFSK